MQERKDPAATPAAIQQQLTGDLPCVVCGYNLRLLSIREVCPECGAQVRATLLAVVDPFAKELAPLRKPWLLAGAVMLWSLGALIASLVLWVPVVVEMSARLQNRPPVRPDIAGWVVACLVVSGIGAVGMIRPHSRVPISYMARAAASVVAYIPLIMLMHRLEGLIDLNREPAYIGGAVFQWSRTSVHLGINILVIAIVLGLRPNARTLAARCLLLRSGRVERQTLLAIAVASLVVIAGDLLGLAAASMHGQIHDLLGVVAVILIAIGSLLTTLGVLGVFVDSVRVARSIMRPGPTMEQLLKHQVDQGNHDDS